MRESDDQAKSKLRQSALQKWQLGLERLTKAEQEPALLGPVMVSLHGALEDQFRYTLATLPQLPAIEQNRVVTNQVQWRELSELMQKHVGLSEHDARYILGMNSRRNEAAHGGEFRGSYPDLAKYADFVKGWVNPTDPVTPTTPPQNGRSLFHRCPRCNSDRVKGLSVIYEQGIAHVERRRGRSETRQTGLSLQAAPPLKKKANSALVWVFVMFFVGMPMIASILGGFAALFRPIPLLGGLLTGILSLLGLVATLAGFIYPFYKIWKYNTTDYFKLLKEWQRTFQCEQCGHRFPVEF